MQRIFTLTLACIAAANAGSTVAPSPAEQLNYLVKWPSGLSLGETHLRSAAASGRLRFGFEVDAAVPGFQVSDRFNSSATTNYCAVEFEKNVRHGRKRTIETEKFDEATNKVSRETKDGDKATLDSSPCAKDALTYLYFVRHELAEGRMPAPQMVYFGAPYQVRLDFAGRQTVALEGRRIEADRFNGTARGESGAVDFEIYFLSDPARTPVLVKVPFSVGTIAMELVK